MRGVADKKYYRMWWASFDAMLYPLYVLLGDSGFHESSQALSHQKPLQPPDLPYVPFKVDPAHDDRLSQGDRAGDRVLQHRLANPHGPEALGAAPQPGLVLVPQTAKLGQASAAFRDHRGGCDAHGNACPQNEQDEEMADSLLGSGFARFELSRIGKPLEDHPLGQDEMLDDLEDRPLSRARPGGEGLRLQRLDLVQQGVTPRVERSQPLDQPHAGRLASVPLVISASPGADSTPAGRRAALLDARGIAPTPGVREAPSPRPFDLLNDLR